MRCEWLIGLALVIAACGDDATPIDAGADAAADATVDATLTPDVPIDVPVDTATAVDLCAELALPVVEFQDSTGTEYGDVAGDFVVQTLDGPWRLSENWSGCESYVFINYAAGLDDLWLSQPAQLLDNSPDNVQYFFTSYEMGDAARTRVEELRDSFDETLSFYSAEEVEAWRARLHFVVDPLLDIEGSAGDRARGQPGIAVAFGIDRAQRFDPVGSLSQVSRGAFVNRLGMAAYASHFYNYKDELARRVTAEDAEIIEFVGDETVTERVFLREATFPDAAAMAGVDTLEVDVEITCRGRAPDCSEWDRIALLELCLDDTCDERREIVRWITPYSRPGHRRWVMDASPFLGYLRDGGPRQIRVVMGPEWEAPTEREVSMRFRLSSTGQPEAFAAERAYVGGNFDADFEMNHPPHSFTVSSEATRVELVVIVSGHGQTETDNCAEWCNHEHSFSVNGRSPSRIDFPREAGRALGCAERASEGVVPGQYGNWAPSRAGWCPGLPVETRRFDITDDIVAGPNELTYSAGFDGGAPRGGSIALSAYVVSYR